MRILNVTQSYAPFYEFGGPPVKVQALAEGLAGRGHEVQVLTVDWGFQDRKLSNEECKEQVYGPFGWQLERNGVSSVYLPIRWRYRATTWNPSAASFCRERLAAFDVVHIFGLYDLLGPRVAAECRNRKIPYVVEPIGMFTPIVRSLLLKRLYHWKWGRKMLAGAAAIIATAEQEADEFRAGGLSKETIVLRRNGVMLPEERPMAGRFRDKNKIPAAARLILFLGRLSSKKSPELLLESFARMEKEVAGKEVWLAFAGPDESGMEARLREVARNQGVENRVVFSGAVFDDMKWAAYGDADIFVLPSQNENFGNTAAEAAAFGTPVVVTENCGVARILQDRAAIVVKHETEELMRAVQQILRDPSVHQRLSEGGKRLRGELGWDEPVRQMEGLYSELAGRAVVVGQSARPGN
jgi:glycosyltransferase involved in cell wall biosynthesis